MNAHLLRHAIKNVWCNPAQDRQYIYRLVRLTPRYGVRGVLARRYRKIVLPTADETYHVYQLGQVRPAAMGLPALKRQWVSLAELANHHLLMTDLYVNSGLQFPRFNTYVRITDSHNLLIAVKPHTRIADLNEEALYLRVYSNAYFESHRSETDRRLYVQGKAVADTDSLLAFQQQLTRETETFDGEVKQYVNGRLVHKITLVTAMVGDVVEAVFDSAIKAVYEFPVTELPAFESERDAEDKYILHPPKGDGSTTIDYVDDVDVYLINPINEVRYLGVYYHQNEASGLRMLTHRDYAISSRRLDSFVATHPTDYRHALAPSQFPEDKWTAIEDLTIRVYVRHSGYQRPLVPTANRIQELYKLTDAQIWHAMTGTDATVDLWHARELEQCPYIRFMSAKPDQVYPIAFNDPHATSEGKTSAQEWAGDVYGYHAAGVVLGNTPTPVYERDAWRYTDLAYNHWHHATVYEHDSEGKLIKWYPHVSGRYHLVRNSHCTRVETVSGLPGEYLASTFGVTAPVETPAEYNTRVYVRPMFGGEPDGPWRDITEADDQGDFGYFDDTTDPVRWVWVVEDPIAWRGLVRNDARVLAYTLELPKSAGHLRFSVSSIETHVDMGAAEHLMEVPPGQLDLWLNGRALIEGLDYTVDWPEVVIANREYLDNDADIQQVQVRAYGLCHADLTRWNSVEHGFVEYGVLSNDGYYALHQHKVQRLIIHGRLFDTADVAWDEDRNAAVIDAVRNGAPYQLQNPWMVFADVYDNDAVARQADNAREKQVTDYLTELLPPRTRDNPDMIPEQYPLVSVFANKLLHDLQTGTFYPDGIEGHYSENDIRDWCRDYEWLLPYDIANREYDQDRVGVHPHWHDTVQTLTLYQYTFYQRALQTYLRYPPNIASFVKIKEPSNGD